MYFYLGCTKKQWGICVGQNSGCVQGGVFTVTGYAQGSQTSDCTAARTCPPPGRCAFLTITHGPRSLDFWARLDRSLTCPWTSAPPIAVPFLPLNQEEVQVSLTIPVPLGNKKDEIRSRKQPPNWKPASKEESMGSSPITFITVFESLRPTPENTVEQQSLDFSVKVGRAVQGREVLSISLERRTHLWLAMRGFFLFACFLFLFLIRW